MSKTELSAIHDQGAAAKKANDEADKTEDAGAKRFTNFDCPYGPGEKRDAWLDGFGGVDETVKQVDTSTPHNQDVRTETAKPVAEPKGKKGGKAKDAVTVRTDLTGTGETGLKTVVEPTNPDQGDRVPNPEAVVGDPRAGTPVEQTTKIDADDLN